MQNVRREEASYHLRTLAGIVIQRPLTGHPGYRPCMG